MNSLMILSCTMGGMAAGFLLGAFYKREMARIDANHWKSMYELERDYRKAPDATPPSTDESASDEQEPFYQLWAEFERLREINAKLVEALEAVEHLVDTEYREGNGMAVMQQVRAALVETRSVTSPSPAESHPATS